jgi:hypothetical protein
MAVHRAFRFVLKEDAGSFLPYKEPAHAGENTALLLKGWKE